MARKKPDPTAEQDLTAKRELFCQYYAHDRELFGNATWAYAAAYGYDLDSLSHEAQYETDIDENGKEIQKLVEASDYDKACHVCAVESSQLLRNPDVDARIVVLLNELLKDEIVDSELAKIIRQDKDGSTKIAAIREFNKLRGRIIDKTQQINRLPFGETDMSTLIATLPQERQDYFYGVITELIREAELVRSNGSAQGSGAR